MIISPDYVFPTRFSTRMKFANAVDTLLQRYDFDNLTIDLICAEAGYGRSSFYRNFSSKLDILIWYDEFAAEQGIQKIGRTLGWEEGRLGTFSVWQDMKTLTAKGARQKGYNSLSRFTVRKRESYFKQTIVDFMGVELTETLAFQAEVYAYLECKVVMDWFKSGFARDPVELSRLLDTVVPHELYELFNHPDASE